MDVNPYEAPNHYATKSRCCFDSSASYRPSDRLIAAMQIAIGLLLECCDLAFALFTRQTALFGRPSSSGCGSSLLVVRDYRQA